MRYESTDLEGRKMVIRVEIIDLYVRRMDAWMNIRQLGAVDC